MMSKYVVYFKNDRLELGKEKADFNTLKEAKEYIDNNFNNADESIAEVMLEDYTIHINKTTKKAEIKILNRCCKKFQSK